MHLLCCLVVCLFLLRIWTCSSRSDRLLYSVSELLGVGTLAQADVVAEEGKVRDKEGHVFYKRQEAEEVMREAKHAADEANKTRYTHRHGQFILDALSVRVEHMACLLNCWRVLSSWVHSCMSWPQFLLMSRPQFLSLSTSLTGFGFACPMPLFGFCIHRTAVPRRRGVAKALRRAGRRRWQR
jgi:hypothetical protein